MIIGITGRSGSGKSFLSDILAEKLDMIHIDIDKISHEVLTFDESKKFLLNEFGSEIFENGVVNRKKLGKIVFGEPEKLEKLNRFCQIEMEAKIDEIIASIALENYEKMWARARSILAPNKKIVEDWVKTQPHLSLKGDAKGTTCLIKYDYDVDSETLAKDAMEDERKILFVPGDYFDEPGTIRVGYGAFGDPQKLIEGLDAFGEYLKKWEK